MKILYGVVGEGMGHAMRSRVVLERLAGYVQDGNQRLYEELDRSLLDSRRSEPSTLERET